MQLPKLSKFGNLFIYQLMEECTWIYPKIHNASGYEAYLELFYVSVKFNRLSMPKLTSTFSDANTSYT